ncbi:metallophosphoesterase [soil metagenome]
MKIVQITDTHLSHRGGATNENFEKIARYINDVLQPAFVVHSGDVSILNPDSVEDRAASHELLKLIEAPLRVLPGNHDVGEPGENPWAGFNATSARTTAFTDVFGEDHWVEIIGDYAIVGFNSEILDTGIPEEQAQWEWLETVAGQVGERPTLVFCHKAFWPPLPGEFDHPTTLPAASLDRLMDVFGHLNVKIFGSGHLHHYQLGRHDSAITVTAPSTAFLAKGTALLPVLDQLGVVEYLCENGEADPFFRSVPDLIEGSPTAIPEFNLALDGLGVTVTI